MWCHNCGDEYEPGMTRCTDCDLPLFDTPRAEATHEIDDSARTVVLGVYDEFEEDIVVDILRGEGIVAFPKTPHSVNSGNPYPGVLPEDRGVIMVEAGRLEEAQRLIAEQLPIHLASIATAMETLPLEEFSE